MLDTGRQLRFLAPLAALVFVLSVGVARAGTLSESLPASRESTTEASDTALEQTLSRFYEQHQPVLDRCRRQIFGSDADRLPDRLLRLRHRPALDLDRDRAGLSRLRRSWLPPGRLIDGLPVPPPYGGPRGTILVVAESHPSIAPQEFLRTYVHELGNLLDYHLHPELDSDVMRHYGSATDPSGDDDTGQQFERCVDALGGFSGSQVLARR